MPRRPRVDFAGFHHVVNRGVARGKIYKTADDKKKFLEILCKACDIYKVNVHDYCLMDNHYHLLIESTQENLSLFMRQINSNYAIYFNKTYKRTGHFWQGRYKSWYIINEDYLYTLFRYIEHNPIKAKMAQTVGEYPFTLLATQLNSNLDVIACAKHSKLIKELEEEGIQELLETELRLQELKELEIEQKKKIIHTEHEFRQEKEKTLQEHFKKAEELSKRNSAIIDALNDGYKQAEVARYLHLSPAAVSKIFRGVK
ncbi:transposase [Sulfurovum sp.]|uniref:transposase n=1 Tax=Sulfurovum sp. TaxID=1969726 RepID=UPI00356A6EC2